MSEMTNIIETVGEHRERTADRGASSVNLLLLSGRNDSAMGASELSDRMCFRHEPTGEDRALLVQKPYSVYNRTDPYYDRGSAGQVIELKPGFTASLGWGLTAPLLFAGALDLAMRNPNFTFSRGVLRFYKTTVSSAFKCTGRASVEGYKSVSKVVIPRANNAWKGWNESIEKVSK